MNEEILRPYIRPVTEDDRKTLPVFSYSKMDVFKSCPYQYDLKYNKEMFTKDTSIALEVGTLCHYLLEQKGKQLVANVPIDYKELEKIKLCGTIEHDEKTKDDISGTDQLSKKYFDLWYEPDNASGMTYEDKMKVFDKVLHKEMENTEWTPVLFEYPFEFVWNNRAIIKGFIDRVDIKGNERRTVDYKTSKKVYDKSKLATSLQFGIYALAILNDFDVLPSESLYRFILLDDEQAALTKGWEKRLIKALEKIFDQIDESNANNTFKPSPSPLCHWCSYCVTNPDAHQYKSECEYFSLWTPSEKTFAVNKEWNPIKAEDNLRKLIF